MIVSSNGDGVAQRGVPVLKFLQACRRLRLPQRLGHPVQIRLGGAGNDQRHQFWLKKQPTLNNVGGAKCLDAVDLERVRVGRAAAVGFESAAAYVPGDELSFFEGPQRSPYSVSSHAILRAELPLSREPVALLPATRAQILFEQGAQGLRIAPSPW